MNVNQLSRLVLLVSILGNLSALAALPLSESGENAEPKSISWAEVGAVVGAQYSGDGLAVARTEHGARLRCVFQRLEGEATPEGLLLKSCVTNQPNDCFGVTAVAVGNKPLLRQGIVAVEGPTVRLLRPEVLEEYTVSVDGVRQDFVVLNQSSRGDVGELRLELSVTGARVESTANGVQLVLANSGRKISYSKLKVTDAKGTELAARMEVAVESDVSFPGSRGRLFVVVVDSNAVYPIRIDPTFSDANWVSMGGSAGADANVNSATVDGDGNLYIGGVFHAVDGIAASSIAKWNGSVWSPLGVGMDSIVYALAVSGGDVYAGGSFRWVTNSGGAAIKVNGLAKWNGNSWSALGLGMNFNTYALTVAGGDVYAGGNFMWATNTGSVAVTVSGIAKWNGSTWSALGSGVSGTVSALAASGAEVYVGGGFARATNGGNVAVTVNNIAKWSGSAWSGLGFGMNSDVNALTVAGSNVYAGGAFLRATNSGGISVTVNRIARWDGNAWSALGSGMSGTVKAISVTASNVYVGGAFGGVFLWNGSGWSSVGSGVGSVNALTAFGNSVYAGCGGIALLDRYIVKWDGARWLQVGSGVDDAVEALAVSGSDVYAGGLFTVAGGNATYHIAKWDGTAWRSVGLGLDGIVNALAVTGSNLYVGGSFRRATNNNGLAVTVTRIAKWNGSEWSALGLGVDNDVIALAISGSNVYVGGGFVTAGGNSIRDIARWDGNDWNALGNGPGGTVGAIAVSGANVFVGGGFAMSGTNGFNHIAKWNGSTWSGLGAGLNGSADALAVAGGDLYAGGTFTTAGGNPSRGIAKWNGSTWSGLGLGVNGYVFALAVSGSNVYAGGQFTMATNSGGSTIDTKCIAAWDGSAWSAMGSGVDGLSLMLGVYALGANSSELYVGGNFTTAGGKSAEYTAKAFIGPPPFFIATTNGSLEYNAGQFHFTLVGPAGSNAVIFASTNLQDWTPLATNPLTGGLLNFTDTLGTNLPRRYYRSLLQP